jgi:hypothetical protein
MLIVMLRDAWRSSAIRPEWRITTVIVGFHWR